MSKPELRIDKKYRDLANWKNDKDQFNKMFRFSDNKGIQNSGGFRYKSKINGSTKITDAAFVLLVTTFNEPEWPDNLDVETGIFTYYGDNRSPGSAINETSIGGNELLEYIFNKYHSGKREDIPPLLIFEKVKTENKSFMKFLGLAAPGAQGLSSTEDLVAVWRAQKGKRFQNYKAIFTVLEEEKLSWRWLQDLVQNVDPIKSNYCPKSWEQWVEKGSLNPLRCKKTKVPRNKADQIPGTEEEKKIIAELLSLSDIQFEFAAREILYLFEKNFTNLNVTPPARDGGRDIVGKYKIGRKKCNISLDLFVEAKKWKIDSSVGVKPMSRLISRMKHKDLGIFITTSYFNNQVQKELIEDSHPIIMISGGDIAKILINNEIGGVNNQEKFDDWISTIKDKTTKNL